MTERRVATPVTVADSWRADLGAAWPGWVAGRLVVGVAWVLNLGLVAWRLDGVEPTPTTQGLFGWDGAYYRGIADAGYVGDDIGMFRFHPLLAIIGHTGWGVLLVANLGGLLAAALLHRLVLEETGDGDWARRTATVVGLAPPAFCLVWAYAEGPFLVLAVVHLLALRRTGPEWSRWWVVVAAAGTLAVLARPSGLLLVVPVLVEAGLGVRALLAARRRPPLGAWAGWILAAAGPVLGMAGYLWWTEGRTGDAFLPLRVQSDLRGGFVLPPLRLLEGIGEVFADPLGDGLHVPFAFATLALVWVCWRRLPASWTALAGAAALVNLAADNLNSTERYAFGTVPLLVALAAVSGGRWWRPTVAIGVAGLLGMTTLAWYGSYVP